MRFFKFPSLVLAAVTYAWGSAVWADLFVGSTRFEGEDTDENIRRLHFTLDQVSWNGQVYQSGITTRFALEGAFGSGFRANLVLIQADDLGRTVTSAFPLTAGRNGVGLGSFGSSGVSDEMVRAISNWQASERAVAGWIIANAAELIELAHAASNSETNPIADWADSASLFEEFLRSAAGPLQNEIAIADQREMEARKLTTTYLRPVVQPGLKNLGYYNGAIDGYWGAGTQAGVKQFQLSLNAVPTGWLTLDQIGQLRQAYGAALTPEAAKNLPWAGGEADLAALTAEANARIAALSEMINAVELELKNTQAAREMALVSLRNSRARIAELEALQATDETVTDVETLETQIQQLRTALNIKNQENQDLQMALEQAKAAAVPLLPISDQSALLAKLQDASETIAALNAQIETGPTATTVPVQRFNRIREDLTRRVATLNTMLMAERDNMTKYRNKWVAARAELDAFMDMCRETTACTEALNLN